MKCTLIRCPQTMAKYVSAAYALPPIGLAYVAASLREAGHDVTIVDTTGEALDRFTPVDADGILLRRGLLDDEILAHIEPDSDVIGFGLMFSQDWLPARALIRKVRAAHPHAVLWGGGEHFTAEPVGAMEDAPIDYILEGEGDRAICDLLEHLAGRRAVEDVAGGGARAGTGARGGGCGGLVVRDRQRGDPAQCGEDPGARRRRAAVAGVGSRARRALHERGPHGWRRYRAPP